ncbi:MAG: PDZ domain-containing protein [Gemmatimonadales bacterium]
MAVRTSHVFYAAVVMSAFIPVGRIDAQVTSSPRPASTVWSTSISYLGIVNIRCDCTVRADGDGSRLFIFRTEPVVLGVVPGSAGEGILYRGDRIIRVDGISILTADGARRVADIRPGDYVGLIVKRGGNTLKLSIKASRAGSPRVYTSVTPEADRGYSIDWEYPATPPEPPVPGIPATPAPRTPRSPRAAALAPVAPDVWVGVVTGSAAVAPAWSVTPAPAAWPTGPAPLAPVVPALVPSPRGWFGFSIRCNDCGWSSDGRPGASPVWESNSPPELAMVAAESPAGRAGLLAGDRITHINGVSIMTREGARRFGAVMPGQRVRLTVVRNGVSLTKELTLATRPEVRAAIAVVTPRTATPRVTRRELRYSGQLENVSVEVWSPGGPTVERIGDTMVITVGGSVVRLQVAGSR